MEVWCKDEALAIMLHGTEGTVEQEKLHPTALYQMDLVTQGQICIPCQHIAFLSELPAQSHALYQYTQLTCQIYKDKFVYLINTHNGGRNSSVGSAWARCHSVAGSILLWGHFPVDGIFPLELTWVQTPFPQNSFGWEYKPRSSLCTHAFHRTDSKDPDVHVLDGWMPATKTHPAQTIHEDGMWLPQWLD